MAIATRTTDLGAGGLAVFAWSIGGVIVILGQAMWRLTPLAIEAFHHGLAPVHWAVLVPWVVFMGYSEWWRGFHQRFSPRVAVRADWLARHPRPWLVVLGPLVAMGLVHAARRRLIASWGILASVVVLVVLVRQLPQPWRGVIDVGVVLGLAAGALSTLWFAGQTLLGRPPAVPAELPRRR